MFELRKVYTVITIGIIIIILVSIGVIAIELNKMNLDIRSRAENIYSLYDIDRFYDDKVIDIRDMNLFMKNFGLTNVCGNIADFNFDCNVNISDFSLIRMYYGKSY